MKDVKRNDRVIVSAEATGYSRGLKGIVTKVEKVLNSTLVGVDFLEPAPDGKRGICLSNLSLLWGSDSVKLFNSDKVADYLVRLSDDGELETEQLTPEEDILEQNEAALTPIERQTYKAFCDFVFSSVLRENYGQGVELSFFMVDVVDKEATAEVHFKDGGALSFPYVSVSPDMLKAITEQYNLKEFTLSHRERELSYCLTIKL